MSLEEKKNVRKRGGNRTNAEDLRILASAESEPKLIENISRDTQIPLERCRLKIAGLVDLGLLIIDHDSDLYGHEFIKVRKVSKEIDN